MRIADLSFFENEKKLLKAKFVQVILFNKINKQKVYVHIILFLIIE